MGTQVVKTDKFELVNQFLVLCVLTTVMGIILSGCGQPGSLNGASTSKSSTPQTSAPPSSPTPEVVQPQNQPTKPVHNISKTITVNETNQADVIIVIDNSPSMRFEQANMAQRFSSLLEEMKDLDWRLGIITTDVSKNEAKKDGRFLEFAGLPGHDHVTSEMDPEIVKVAFAATIQRPSREGNANEQGIKATYRALERRPEWLRANASLNVVVVTDADETPRKGKAETRNNPSDLLKFIKSENPSKPFFFHSIIVKEGDAACLKKDDNESYGRIYAWLSKKTGGIIGDVCQKDYSNQLKLIGEKVSQQIKSVDLECEPLPGSMIVKVGTDLITEFTVEGSRLLLARPLPVGTTELNYQCYGNP